MTKATREGDQNAGPLLDPVDAIADWSQVGDGDLVDLMVTAVERGNLDLAATMLRRRHGSACAIRFSLSSEVGGARVLWELNLPHEMHFAFAPEIAVPGAAKMTLLNFVWLSPLFMAYAEGSGTACGRVLVNLFDVGLSPGLAFCDHRTGYFLIPDNLFISQRGYSFAREHYSKHHIPWNQRKPTALWRGNTTGQVTDYTLGWRSLPRIRLCELAKAYPDRIDAGITGVVQFDDPDVAVEIAKHDIMRSFVPVTEFQQYKYQIDIDGNTNSWPGLFQKLLTGSPVLKIASPGNFRQWYYDKLHAWTNFVPVLADMSDLGEKIHWLMSHDEVARGIGEQGRLLAESMTFGSELKRGCEIVQAALKYFSGSPELNLDLGTGRHSEICSMEGWLPIEGGGLPASGTASQMVLAKPIAPGSFVLSVDVGPYLECQRDDQILITIANGKNLGEEVVSERRTFNYHLEESTIQASERLTLHFLHPNPVKLSSARFPLDLRQVSIMAYRVALTPASLRPSALAEGPRSPSVDPRWRPQSSDLVFERVLVLPPKALAGRLRTDHGTLVFVDPIHRLMHGPIDTSPRNLSCARVGDDLYLLYEANEGRQYSLHFCFPQRAEIPESDGRIVGSRLEIVGDWNDADGFGISCDGLFLCAEGDGRMTLSRHHLGPWERFRQFHD